MENKKVKKVGAFLCIRNKDSEALTNILNANEIEFHDELSRGIVFSKRWIKRPAGVIRQFQWRSKRATVLLFFSERHLAQAIAEGTVSRDGCHEVLPFISSRQDRKSRESEEINRLMKAYGLERKQFDTPRKAKVKRRRSKKPANSADQAQEDGQDQDSGHLKISMTVSQEVEKQAQRLDNRLSEHAVEFEQNFIKRIEATESRVTNLEENRVDEENLKAELTERMDTLDGNQVKQAEFLAAIESIAKEREDDQQAVKSLTDRITELEGKLQEQKDQFDEQIRVMDKRLEESIAKCEEAFNSRVATLEKTISKLDDKSSKLERLINAIESKSGEALDGVNQRIEDYHNQISTKVDDFEDRLLKSTKSTDEKATELKNIVKGMKETIDKISSNVEEEKSRLEKNTKVIEGRIAKDLQHYLDSKIDSSISNLKNTSWKPSAETLERMLMDIGYMKGSFDSQEKTTQRIQNNLRDVTHEASDRRVEIMALSKDVEHSRKQMDWELQEVRRESMINKWNLEQNIVAATIEANRQVALYLRNTRLTQAELIEEGNRNMKMMHDTFYQNMVRLEEVCQAKFPPQTVRKIVEDTKKIVMTHEANQCLIEAETMIHTHPVTCVVYHCGSRSTWRPFEATRVTGDQISAKLVSAGFLPGSFIALHEGKLIQGTSFLNGPLIVVEIVFNIPNFMDPTLLPLVELPTEENLPASCETSVVRRGGHQ